MISLFAEKTLDAIVSESDKTVENIELFRADGYADSFFFSGNYLVSEQTKRKFLPIELEVDDIFCADEIGCEGYYIYALSHLQIPLKGLLTVFIPDGDYQSNERKWFNQ